MCTGDGVEKATRVGGTYDLRSFLITAGVAVVITTVLLAIYFLVGVKPLSAFPQESSALQSQAATAATSISNAQTVIGQTIGKDVAKATEGSAAAQVYGNTFLPGDDESVSALQDATDECQADLDLAVAYQDPAKTLVGRSTDPGKTPQIITIEQVHDLTSSLSECTGSLDTEGVQSAWDQTRNTAALTQAQADNAMARTSLQAAVDTANGVLAGSAGKVADDQVRQALQTAIDQATAALSVEAPSDGYETVDTDTANLIGLTGPLATATQTVSDAQTAWQAEQDQAAASKKTTYSGGSTTSTKPGTTHTGGAKTSSGSKTTTSHNSGGGVTSGHVNRPEDAPDGGVIGSGPVIGG